MRALRPLDTTPRGVHQPALALLAEHGIVLAPQTEESELAFGDRIDTRLMALFRDGGAAAVFETLYQRARGSVFDLVRRASGERGLPFDPFELVQDTFINVYRYAKSFRDDHPASFRAWVRTIAHHTVFRAASRRRMRSLQSLPEGLQEPADERQSPTRGLAEREDARLLAGSWMLFLEHYARAYERLSPRDRLALKLVEVDGLSYAAAASELRVGRSNMKMILFRARARIQARMRAAMTGKPASPATARPSAALPDSYRAPSPRAAARRDCA
jgi:RNA polymerase sigma-70 factor (ECF subfamily)